MEREISSFNSGWDLSRTFAQQVRRQNVQLCSLIDGFYGISFEQIIRPCNQVVEVFHQYIFHVCQYTHTGDQVWIERVFFPFLHLCHRIRVIIMDADQQIIYRLDRSPRNLIEFLEFPVALHAISSVAGRVEDIMIPFLCFSKLLVVAQLLCD
ncbi:hypothetical protein D3C72_508580 [compost metagenome]